MRKRYLTILVLIAAALLLPASALAQSYSLRNPQKTVNVYWNSDGSASIDYVFVFANDPGAPFIEYVDVGIPNNNYDFNSITADVDGNPVYDISSSDYQGSGDSGVAVGLGQYSIPPGQTGTVHVNIGRVENVLRTDSGSDNYASAVFIPTWIGSEYAHGATNLSVVYHLPLEVQPDEPRWHEAPDGFPSEPATGFDEQGRITYTWTNPNASPSEQYRFGASFPAQYVPATAVRNPSIFETLGISADAVITFVFCCGFAGFFILIIIAAARSSQQRKLQYLPPKISIEGHGIKRGLTAVEAALLLQEPLDKILTMILFGVVKKNAARVVTRDPLEIEALQPQPEDLNPYEVKFLEAFQEKQPAARRKALQDMMIDLVKEVSQKMKGFSRAETVAYYKDIMNRAWAQVEAADTPEVKSAKYDEVMEWTMLDRNYDDRTRRVFTGYPVFIPTWWHNYDPTWRGGGSVGRPSGPASTPSSSGGGMSLPNLPGSDFAASVVNGTQAFAAGVIGNVTEFTGRVTDKTNPVPVATSSGRSYGGGRSGGGGCACACACAGCACACAGGGR